MLLLVMQNASFSVLCCAMCLTGRGSEISNAHYSYCTCLSVPAPNAEHVKAARFGSMGMIMQANLDRSFYC
jgi:hypothetical protein